MLVLFVSSGLLEYADWMLGVGLYWEEVKKDINTQSTQSEQVRKNTGFPPPLNSVI